MGQSESEFSDTEESEASDSDNAGSRKRCLFCKTLSRSRDKFCGGCGRSFSSQKDFNEGMSGDIWTGTNIGDIQKYDKNSVQWKTPDLHLLVSEKRKIELPGVDPSRLISCHEVGRMWINVSKPPNSPEFLIPDVMTKQISSELALMLGYTPNELVGKRLSFLLPMDLYQNEDYAQYSLEMERKMEKYSGYCYMSAPNIYRHKHGSLIGVLFHAIMFLDQRKFSSTIAFLKNYCAMENHEVGNFLNNRKVEIMLD